MKEKFATAKLTSIEEEIKVLKSQLKDDEKAKGKKTTFSSLKGIWKGKVHFSFKEIKEAEIRLKEIL